MLSKTNQLKHVPCHKLSKNTTSTDNNIGLQNCRLNTGLAQCLRELIRTKKVIPSGI